MIHLAPDQATGGVCFPGYNDGTEQLTESTRLRYTGELNRTCTDQRGNMERMERIERIVCLE
ncbi:hypothetical protein F511_26051 [Dorcoceras hygrometricum]|uniref:Uncharacterized protein n=1 Tax=Dorcoceras hygrometricum TaxID=472368 RepID=A0A2Z7CRB2_9LAMI|nr:hypothetical protein F511_26051 [Dorcoceras hygrometricum]